jgi:hypothetical protein
LCLRNRVPSRFPTPAFTAGAGRIGLYHNVCYSSTGTTQFIPGPTSTPAIGTPGQQELVQEVKLEFTVGEDAVRKAVEAVRKVHPYEEVVVDVYRLEEF